MTSPRSQWLRAVAILMCVAGPACTKPAPFARTEKKPRDDRPAPFNPSQTYPEWAYDAPSYMKPESELAEHPRNREKDPPHYFTNKTLVMVHQPTGYSPEETPRVAIWWSNDNGFHWHKAGYYGRGEGFYPLQVKTDGDYGVRFVGPGQEAAMESLPNPVKVYHVDTKPPKVTVSVDPEQAWYNIGQHVNVSWKALDPHLLAQPARLFVITDWESDRAKPIEVKGDLADAGTMEYTIPGDLLGDAFRFRVDAQDRAGNIGIAYSHTLQIVNEPVDGSKRPPVQMSSYHGSTAAPFDEKKSGDGANNANGAAGASSSGNLEMLPLEEIPTPAAKPMPSSGTPSGSSGTRGASAAPTGDDRTPGAPDAGPSKMTHDAATPSDEKDSPADSAGHESRAMKTSGDDSDTTASDSNEHQRRAIKTNDRDSSATASASSKLWATLKSMGTKTATPSKSETDGTIVNDHPIATATDSDDERASRDSDEASPPVKPVKQTNSTTFHIVPIHDESADAKRDEPVALSPDIANLINSPTGDDCEGENAAPAAQPEQTPTVAKGTSGGSSPLSQGVLEELIDFIQTPTGPVMDGGLAAPMPATVGTIKQVGCLVPPHPWRALADSTKARTGDIWTLPTPSLKYELGRMFAQQAATFSDMGPAPRAASRSYSIRKVSADGGVGDVTSSVLSAVDMR